MSYRHWTNVATLAFVVGAYCAVSTHAQAQADAKATAVMANVRKALGGEQKLAGMKGLSLRADYRREMSAGAADGGGTTMFVMMGGGGTGSASGGAQLTGKMEIDLDYPDKYLRSDIGSAAFSMTRTEGFEGSRPFIELVPNSPGMRVMTDNPSADPARAKAALKRSHADLARLLLGLTGSTQPGFPVTCSYSGQAESPDGKADIIDVTGPDEFKARLFVDAETHLPLMVTYSDVEPRVVMRTAGGGPGGARGAGPATVVTPGAAPAGGARGEGSPLAQLTPEQREELDKRMKEAEAAPPKMVEYRLYFSDFRKVDGVSLPHHIARGTGSTTTEEWDVTSYKVNPSFKTDRFKVGS